MLDGALYDFALTCGYDENIGNVPMEVWGQRGTRRGGRGSPGPAKPIAVVGGLWVGLQASVKHT